MGLRWVEPLKTYSKEIEKDCKSVIQNEREGKKGKEHIKWRKRKGQRKKGRDVIRDVFSFLFFLWTRSYGKLIVSTAYLPFSPPQSNKHTKSDWKVWNAQQQKSDSSGSTALQHSLCFHYHIVSWKPCESADGAMDYPACMGCRLGSMKDTYRVSQGKGILQTESRPQGLK